MCCGFREDDIMVHGILGVRNELHATNESQYSNSVYGSTSYTNR